MSEIFKEVLIRRIICNNIQKFEAQFFYPIHASRFFLESVIYLEMESIRFPGSISIVKHQLSLSGKNDGTGEYAIIV